MSKLHYIFYALIAVIARSSSDYSAIHYILLVLWIRPSLHFM